MENKKEQILKEFESKLDQWTDTKEHLFSCIGYCEGQRCCIENNKDNNTLYGDKGRPKLIELVNEALSSQRQQILEAVEKEKLIEAAFPGSHYTLDWKKGHNKAVERISELIKNL